MSVRDQIKRHFTPYKHDEEYRRMMTKFRGLLRTWENLERTMKGQPPLRRKRRANPSTNSTDS